MLTNTDIRRELDAAGVGPVVEIEEYLKAFAPLKARLTEMRLNGDQLEELRKMIDSCTETFTISTRRRMGTPAQGR